jgi:CelD/BcsL family acetyltransferase involved in cellulose biosynthesis
MLIICIIIQYPTLPAGIISSMQFQVIKTEAEWESIAQEWNKLLTHSACHIPFLRHEYLVNWWQTCGGGEWDAETSQLNIITATRDAGLIGIAPLFSGINKDNEPVLMFIGSFEVSDYLDVIARPDDLNEFIQGLLNFISTDPETRGKKLDLYNFSDCSLTPGILKEIALRSGWTFSEEPLQPCPVIKLPRDWESYLAMLDKKQRHEIRRKMRRADEAEGGTDFYFVNDLSSLDGEAQDFIAMMANDPEKLAFLTPLMRQYLGDLAKVALTNGWLNLAFLTINGEKVAGYFSFLFENRLWIYNSAWNNNYSDYSAGWVLLGHLIYWAIQQGIEEVDFMRGDESYKHKFGGVNRELIRCILGKA